MYRWEAAQRLTTRLVVGAYHSLLGKPDDLLDVQSPSFSTSHCTTTAGVRDDHHVNPSCSGDASHSQRRRSTKSDLARHAATHVSAIVSEGVIAAFRRVLTADTMDRSLQVLNSFILVIYMTYVNSSNGCERYTYAGLCTAFSLFHDLQAWSLKLADINTVATEMQLS